MNTFKDQFPLYHQVTSIFSYRSTGSSRFWRNHILIHLDRSLWMDLMHVGKMSRKGRFWMLVMTGNLLPGHKEFVSPDPHRASWAAKGEMSVLSDVPHRPQFSVQTTCGLSVLTIILLLLVSVSTSDYLSWFLKGESYITQCVPMFISMAIDYCLCAYMLLLQCVKVINGTARASCSKLSTSVQLKLIGYAVGDSQLS